MSTTPTKRRRVDEEGATGVVSPEPAASTNEPRAEDAPSEDDLIQPVLEEIPKLVLVDLQKDEPDAVAETLHKLCGLLEPGSQEFDKNKQEIAGLAVTTIILIMRK